MASQTQWLSAAIAIMGIIALQMIRSHRVQRHSGVVDHGVDKLAVPRSTTPIHSNKEASLTLAGLVQRAQHKGAKQHNLLVNQDSDMSDHRAMANASDAFFAQASAKQSPRFSFGSNDSEAGSNSGSFAQVSSPVQDIICRCKLECPITEFKMVAVVKAIRQSCAICKKGDTEGDCKVSFDEQLPFKQTTTTFTRWDCPAGSKAYDKFCSAKFEAYKQTKSILQASKEGSLSFSECSSQLSALPVLSEPKEDEAPISLCYSCWTSGEQWKELIVTGEQGAMYIQNTQSKLVNLCKSQELPGQNTGYVKSSTKPMQQWAIEMVKHAYKEGQVSKRRGNAVIITKFGSDKIFPGGYAYFFCRWLFEWTANHDMQKADCV